MQETVNEGDVLPTNPLLAATDGILHYVPQALCVLLKIHVSLTSFWWVLILFKTCLYRLKRMIPTLCAGELLFAVLPPSLPMHLDQQR